MTSPDDVFAAGARELIKRSQALGISWRLATGTIVNAPLTQGSSARSSATVQSYVLMDGDTVAITVNNMTGTTLPVGTRVYVVMTPPSGNFIVGTVGLVAGPGASTRVPFNGPVNWHVGNGSVTSYYQIVGIGLVKFWGTYTVGSTDNPSGNLNMTLPITPFFAPSTVGTMYASQNSTGHTYQCTVELFSTIAFGTYAPANVTSSNPFLTAVNDQYFWDITYAY